MHRNVTGVLNDFNLAQLTTPDNVYPRGFDRTATTPFLALDLLAKDAQDGKVERRYRHDLESFLWVLMWITACYDSGVESIPDDHCRWLDEDVIACLDAKTCMLGVKIVTTDSYWLLRGVTDVLRNYWDLFYSRRRKEMSGSVSDEAWISINESSDASSSTLFVALELSDEQVLLNLLRVFASNPTANRMSCGPYSALYTVPNLCKSLRSLSKLFL